MRAIAIHLGPSGARRVQMVPLPRDRRGPAVALRPAGPAVHRRDHRSRGASRQSSRGRVGAALSARRRWRGGWRTPISRRACGATIDRSKRRSAEGRGRFGTLPAGPRGFRPTLRPRGVPAAVRKAVGRLVVVAGAVRRGKSGRAVRGRIAGTSTPDGGRAGLKSR